MYSLVFILYLIKLNKMFRTMEKNKLFLVLKVFLIIGLTFLAFFAIDAVTEIESSQEFVPYVVADGGNSSGNGGCPVPDNCPAFPWCCI